MTKSNEILRIKFKSQTDIEITDSNLTKYEEWLENISINKLNKDLAIENEYLRNKMDEALDIIYSGLSKIPQKAM